MKAGGTLRSLQEVNGKRKIVFLSGKNTELALWYDLITLDVILDPMLFMALGYIFFVMHCNQFPSGSCLILGFYVMLPWFYVVLHCWLHFPGSFLPFKWKGCARSYYRLVLEKKKILHCWLHYCPSHVISIRIWLISDCWSIWIALRKRNQISLSSLMIQDPHQIIEHCL